MLFISPVEFHTLGRYPKSLPVNYTYNAVYLQSTILFGCNSGWQIYPQYTALIAPTMERKCSVAYTLLSANIKSFLWQIQIWNVNLNVISIIIHLHEIHGGNLQMGVQMCQIGRIKVPHKKKNGTRTNDKLQSEVSSMSLTTSVTAVLWKQIGEAFIQYTIYQTYTCSLSSDWSVLIRNTYWLLFFQWCSLCLFKDNKE